MGATKEDAALSQIIVKIKLHLGSCPLLKQMAKSNIMLGI